MGRDNLWARFEESAASFSGKTAIYYMAPDGWTALTYGELKSRVESVSAILAREGVGKGDKVALMLENGPEWPVIFFATLSRGAISVPISFNASPGEIENILKDSGARLFFSERNVAPQVLSGGYKEIEPSDLVCILYTSGTTDQPKGVMLTHSNLLSNCESLKSMDIVSSTDTIVSILPLHHIYPLTITMIMPIIYGGTIVYPASLKPEDISRAMKELNPTVFVAVPQVLHSFHKRITEQLKMIPFPIRLLLNASSEYLYSLRRRSGINLSKCLFRAIHKRFGGKMRLFVSGGAKLDGRVERDLFKFGFTIVEGYGLTETSPVLSFNPVRRPKMGSVGRAIPGVELKIIKKDEKGVGEVVARGPNIMKGYYKREGLTNEAIRDGWFYTGDLGYFDEDGYLFLTGRLKEVIVLSSGLNIYPEEVEGAYMTKAPVKEMCVFEAPSEKGPSETLVLWAVVRPDLDYFRKYGEVNLRSVIKERFDNVSRELPGHKRLMGFYITLDELPHTPLGKIKRFEVKKMYSPKIAAERRRGFPREESAEEVAIMASAVAGKVINCLKKASGFEQGISASDSLELDLGIDSLGRIELASCLESELGVKIKDEIVGQSFLVKDLISGIGRIMAEPVETRPAGAQGETGGPGYWKAVLDVLPEKYNIEKIDLHPGFWDWLGCFLFASCVYAIFKIFYNLKVEGSGSLPKKGPYILYANHTTYFDGLLVAVSMPRFPRLDLFFVGFRPYFNVMIVRNLIKIGRIIPLDFSSHLLEALRSAYYVLKNGRSLCLFPEGVRSLDGNIKDFKKGFGVLAKESGAILVPVLIEGAFEAWPRTSKYPKPHPIKVRFGTAVKVGDLEDEGIKMGAQECYGAICLAAKERLRRMKEIK